MNHLLKTSLLAVYICSAAHLFAQSTNLGIPFVQGFSRNDYKGGTQIWDISQSDNGIMWFANNEGILEYDGARWQKHPMPNGTIVRSVAADHRRVFVGAQDDFGYLEPDGVGRMSYTSLLPLVPAPYKEFGDVWDIEVTPAGVFFRTDSQLFRFAEGRLGVLFPANTRLLFMGRWNEKLIVQDVSGAFHEFRGGKMWRVAGMPPFTTDILSGMLTLNDGQLLVSTIKNGFFVFDGTSFRPWRTSDDAFLKENRIYCAKALPGGRIAVGTSLNGFVWIGKDGTVIQHLNKQNGLHNNTVLSIGTSRGGRVWIGLDNGIDLVDLSSPLSIIYPDGDLEGAGYAVGMLDEQLYFGMNTGLYAIAWKQHYKRAEKRDFRLVAGSAGQVWSLNKLGSSLLMGHHEGAFDVSSTALVRKISAIQGVWKFIPITDELAVAGHYDGLALFKKINGSWLLKHRLTGLSESSRILAKDQQGRIWMAHPYRGIYRIAIDTQAATLSYTYYGKENGLPDDIGNHLFQLGERLVFTGKQGIFEWDESSGHFLPHPDFAEHFSPSTTFTYLMQDKDGNVWYSTGQETGILRVENSALKKKVTKIPIPELRNQLTGTFPFVFVADRENVFIPTGHGVLHFNPAGYFGKQQPIQVFLHEVRLTGNTDSLLYGGYSSQQDLPPTVLKASQNSIHFTFSTPDFPASEFVQFSHRMDGLDAQWSDWYSDNGIAYNHLPPGKYTWWLRAKSPSGAESAPIAFRFTILPPWYRSTWAYSVYGLLLLGLMYWIVRQQKKRYEREKQDMVYLHSLKEAQHELEVRKSREEINRLQQEKLEAEINHQAQELASATMHLVQKSEIHSALQAELYKLRHSAMRTTEMQQEISRMLKMLDRDADLDQDWEYFAGHFDQVHSNFLQRLGDQYPDLSRNDLKLCAYLRMNLSSKEIALLMNVSIRGVEASRYRLRKRLGIHTETNLSEFLLRF